MQLSVEYGYTPKEMDSLKAESNFSSLSRILFASVSLTAVLGVCSIRITHTDILVMAWVARNTAKLEYSINKSQFSRYSIACKILQN